MLLLNNEKFEFELLLLLEYYLSNMLLLDTVIKLKIQIAYFVTNMTESVGGLGDVTCDPAPVA